MDQENIFYNPDKHPTDTLKSFKSFCSRFDLRYNAQFPDPPKTAMDGAIQRWKLENTTEEMPNPVPTVDQYDALKASWKEKDKLAKVLGMFSSPRLYSDWEVAQPNEDTRNNATWREFKTTMETFYRPTENPTLTNYQFRSISQISGETFPSFCNRVEKEAKSCSFKCTHADCSAETTAIRDQIIIGTSNGKIREEALLQSWNLNTLRTEGMKIESASRGEAEISGEKGAINKISASKYSFSNLKNKKDYQPKGISCYNCGEYFKGPAFKHKEVCKARNNQCKHCRRVGHFPKFCHSVKFLQTEQSQPKSQADVENLDYVEPIVNDVYNVNIFKVNISKPSNSYKNEDFTVEVLINGCISSVTADTGARVSVCSKAEAMKWNLMSRIVPSQVHIKPYQSPTVKTLGMARCSVSFGSTSIPVEWFILEGECEPILSGPAAVSLGIVSFSKSPGLFRPINTINAQLDNNQIEQIQNILAKRPEIYSNQLGKHNSYQVKLHTIPDIKPIISPIRPTPYHLTERIDKMLQTMINNDVIEEHPIGEPTPWISNAHLVPKKDGSLRMTLDAKNLNKSIISTNLPIPRPEDIKAKLAGSSIFSKVDFTSAYWQLELHPDSRNLTTFSLNNKLYRYKRLVMGVKPAQGELNAALLPLFRHIEDAHLIHDDLIIASKSFSSHLQALDEVHAAVQNAGLTLNREKCEYGMDEVRFWGMLINKYGIQPDPEKVEALDGLSHPKNKEELRSFLCMMQSVSDFIPEFSRKASVLRELLREKTHYRWEDSHQRCFEDLLSEFKKDVLLRFFDKSKPIFIFTDAHISGLGAILAQGNDIESAKPVAIASRSTTPSEKKYPQIDLEGLAVDYGLHRFRNYIIGAPHEITVVTDHLPLCAVFNGNRSGSIRTERYKQRNQDIRFSVAYRKGKINQTDFLSRRSVPLENCTKEDLERADDINNLLYTLHTTPIMDKISLAAIAEETAKDEILKQLREIITKGHSWIPQKSDAKLKRFQPILSEITSTGNGILLKNDRIILPQSLQLLAIQLAHQGSHPGTSAMERRLRYHFYFHNMNSLVEKFVFDCPECNLFSDKKVKEPQKSHNVPTKCWEKVSVDLFGPMPSKNHVIVVQDIGSRFPAAKLVSSTAASKVIPALTNIYNQYGNPQTQLSDNGPPFNSSAMEKFTQDRSINMQKIPPGHPSANPVETFMKSVGKTMKIANYTGCDEQSALNKLLENYRDTPHPATGVPPAAMLYRDGLTSVFPRKSINDRDIATARERDSQLKLHRESHVNSSKYKKSGNVSVGDSVLVRNYNKTSKFDTVFSPDPFVVIGVADEGRKLLIEKYDGTTLTRHPDDLKPCITSSFFTPEPPIIKPQVNPWEILNTSDNDGDLDCVFVHQNQNQVNPPQAAIPQQDQLIQRERRRPTREVRAPERLGAHVYNEEQPFEGENDVIQPWWPGYPRD